MLGKGIFHDLLLNNIGFTNKDLHTETNQNFLAALVTELRLLKTLVFSLFNSITMMDGPTDGWTDKASYRVLCPQLKMRKAKVGNVVGGMLEGN